MRLTERCLTRSWLFLPLLLTLLASGGVGRAQDTAAEEAANRRAVLARLPDDAAKRVFGQETSPAQGPAQPIGGYSKGCLAGGVPLPADGADWEVMRPSRNRAWGHPSLIAFIEGLAAAARAQAGWPGLLVGDMGQPRGGPMLTGHASHQIGLDADIWLRPMPDRRFGPAERDEVSSTNVVAANGDDVDPSVWTPQHRKLLETAARNPNVARIFVNPAIKRALCREAGADRDWLRIIRPWWGHNYHFHVRLRCPPGAAECQNQALPPPGDGCGADLAWWFTPEGRHPEPGPPPRPVLMSQMPAGCASVADQR
ncbi:MAG: penicillin-insensitive murein endopeptidase [Alphaproteobacteria bacterium]|nr:penicillin-insensitive murein endopeptidase [Alphaproteobacteria bacterium]